MLNNYVNLKSPEINRGSNYLLEVKEMYFQDCYFNYGLFSSQEFGLKFAWMDKTPDTSLTSNKSYTHVKNKISNKFDISSSNYEEPLSFDVEIMADRVLEDNEVREIYRALFNRNKYEELTFPSYDDDIVFNCVFTNVERIEGGIDNSYGVVGFSAVVICDAPWGWSSDIVHSYSPVYTDDGVYVTVLNQSDTSDYVYPVITFTIPAASECQNCTRQWTDSSCLACRQKSVCGMKGSNNESLTPRKAMIINTSDNGVRGICIFAQDNEISVEMNPKTGSIKSGDNVLISDSNKAFIRLVPEFNELYLENVKNLKIKYREAKILV